MITATIIAPDELTELGVEYDNGKLYAGFIHNTGISYDWIMDYDNNFTFDENLEALCDLITDTWESDDPDIPNERLFR